jgi:hypothetical protein
MNKKLDELIYELEHHINFEIPQHTKRIECLLKMAKEAKKENDNV